MAEDGLKPVGSAADIAAFDTVTACETGAQMEVRNPRTGEVLRHEDGRAFTITFLGKDSDTFRTLARQQSDRRIASSMRTRAPTLTAVAEKDDLELIVAMTQEWDIILDGKPAPCDAKSYRAAYLKYPWLREQGDEFVGVRANFIKD